MTSESAPPPAPRPATFWTRLSACRFLFVVYGLALIPAVWEVLHRAEPVNLHLDSQLNFADTFFELYPTRGEAQYEKAVQSLLCLRAESMESSPPPACRQYDGKDLRREIRRTFEQALETRIKTNEELYYAHLQILVGSQAPKSKIDAAYTTWRRNFPLSSLPDPRHPSVEGNPPK